MEGITDDRDIILSYVHFHRRANVQHLTLLLNTYWAHAAFDLGPIDCLKIRELVLKVKNNASAILKICQAPQRQKRDGKRSHPNIDHFEPKRSKL